MQSLPKGRYELLSIVYFVFKLITNGNQFSLQKILYKQAVIIFCEKHMIMKEKINKCLSNNVTTKEYKFRRNHSSPKLTFRS